MVKNTTGGSSHKKFARKNQGGSNEFTWNRNDPYLIEVTVTKPLGDCRFHVVTKDKKTLICHVSSRFSGRFKHHNMVIANSMLLVSLRPYENPAKHCDFIHKLSDTTPLDFFPGQVNNTSMESDLDIFRNHAVLPTDTVTDASAKIESIPEDADIDFDAI